MRLIYILYILSLTETFPYPFSLNNWVGPTGNFDADDSHENKYTCSWVCKLGLQWFKLGFEDKLIIVQPQPKLDPLKIELRISTQTKPWGSFAGGHLHLKIIYMHNDYGSSHLLVYAHSCTWWVRSVKMISKYDHLYIKISASLEKYTNTIFYGYCIHMPPSNILFSLLCDHICNLKYSIHLLN